MTSKRTLRLRQQAIIRSLPVRGVAKVDGPRVSARDRVCESEACPLPLPFIRVGEEYVRVLWSATAPRPPEDFHPGCFRYEFLE